MGVTYDLTLPESGHKLSVFDLLEKLVGNTNAEFTTEARSAALGEQNTVYVRNIAQALHTLKQVRELISDRCSTL